MSIRNLFDPPTELLRTVAVGLAIGAVLLSVAVALPCGTAAAQDAADEDKQDDGVEDITLTTKDDVILACTWYPPEKGDDETVPIIILHGAGGSRGDFEELALELQAAGHAVIVPDLRGHGESTQRKNSDTPIDATRMRSADYGNMVQYDVETVKKFLMDQNNAGKVNIEMLCIVASDMGSVVGVNFAARDWSWPQLPAIKQGQDVKALVLISPTLTYRGFPAARAFTHKAVRKDLSIMILVGEKHRTDLSAANRIYNMLKGFHPVFKKPDKDMPEQERKALLAKQRDLQKLFFFKLDTSLQGAKLVDAKSLGAAARIKFFIKYRLTDKKKEDEFKWTDRSR